MATRYYRASTDTQTHRHTHTDTHIYILITSASITKEEVPSLMACPRDATTSGYLPVVSSELREKILISPEGSLWICVAGWVDDGVVF